LRDRHLQNNHSKTDRRWDSNDRASTLDARSPELKTQCHPKKKKVREKKNTAFSIICFNVVKRNTEFPIQEKKPVQSGNVLV
jgi:hypothetical protein